IHHPVALQNGAIHRIRDHIASSIERIVQWHHFSGAVNEFSEIASTELVERGGHQRSRLTIPGGSMFVGEEEERLVAAVESLGKIDRPAHAAAGIPLTYNRSFRSRRGEATGVENLIAVEHKDTAVDLVGSRLRNPVNHAVGSTAVFCGVRGT